MSANERDVCADCGVTDSAIPITGNHMPGIRARRAVTVDTMCHIWAISLAPRSGPWFSVTA
jgi:hypothetical protein